MAIKVDNVAKENAQETFETLSSYLITSIKL